MATESTQTIYDDLEALAERVTTLESTVTNLSSQAAALQEQVADTGWIDLPLVGDVQAYNDDLKPKYRKIGNQVFLSGVVKNISAANTMLARLPEGFRPIRQNYFVGGSSTISTGEATFFNCQVNADGYIRITTHSSATYNSNYYLRLNGSFLVD